MGQDLTLLPVLQYVLGKYLALAFNVNFLAHGLRKTSNFYKTP